MGEQTGEGGRVVYVRYIAHEEGFAEQVPRDAGSYLGAREREAEALDGPEIQMRGALPIPTDPKMISLIYHLSQKWHSQTKTFAFDAAIPASVLWMSSMTASRTGGSPTKSSRCMSCIHSVVLCETSPR